MSKAEILTEEEDMPESLAVLLNVPFKFWVCGCRGCVKWYGKVAVCEVCGNSNKAEKAEQQLADAMGVMERLAGGCCEFEYRKEQIESLLARYKGERTS